MRTKDEHKERMLHEHAIRLIVSKGFDGLSMQKLADACKLSSSTIYVYFKNREDLLNKVYNRVEYQHYQAVMRGFDPLMGFEEGLWLQWKNRYKYIMAYPLQFRFTEQFRNSPLIDNNEIEEPNANGRMAIFFQNAIRKQEIVPLPSEMIWALAFGPLYTLVKMSVSEEITGRRDFQLSDRKLKILFEQTLRALRPETKHLQKP